MKRKLLLLAAIGGFFSITLSSYNIGMSGFSGGANRTGAPTSPGNLGCNITGCHACQPGTMNITLFDMTVGGAVSSAPYHFYSNHQYRVLMTFTPTAGDNTSGTSRAFGFQLCSYAKSGNSVVNAPGGGSGDFTSPTGGSVVGSAGSSSYYNAYVASGCSMVEQATKIQSLYTPGSIHDSSWVQWFPSDTATTGATIDSVGFWGIYIMTDTSNYNLVPGTGVPNNGKDIQGNGHTVMFYRHTTSVAEVFGNVNIVAYPNPVSSELHIALKGANTGNYRMNVYDLSGRRIQSENVNVDNSVYTINLGTSNWPMGLYQVQLMKDGVSKTIAVMKQ